MSEEEIIENGRKLLVKKVKTVEELPSKGSTPLREAVEHVRASGRRPGKKLESMFTALDLVDEKPEAANQADGTAKPHVGLLERTLRSRRSKGVKMLSWNIKSMNVIDYKDAEFAQIVQEKAANYASAATEAGARAAARRVSRAAL